MFDPKVEKNPPFNITRASHVRYRVRDLDESVRFYTEVLGFFISDREADAVYLRGIEEACHHSIVLLQRQGANDGGPFAECVGMRVGSAEDLERAKDYFPSHGGTAEYVDRPHQGPTLLTTFGPDAPPIELVTRMPTLPRLLHNFPAQKGGRVLRLDHYQCVVSKVTPLALKFMALGFRPSKYMEVAGANEVRGIFMARKNNPHDLVLAEGAGPRLHHSAYVVSDLQAMLRTADIAAALGYGRNVERGIGRHGPPNGVFLYLRDPDGHRIEFILPPMQFMDPEEAPNAWDSTDDVSILPWGEAPPRRWQEEMTQFVGIEPAGGPVARYLPELKPHPVTR